MFKSQRNFGKYRKEASRLGRQLGLCKTRCLTEVVFGLKTRSACKGPWVGDVHSGVSGAWRPTGGQLAGSGNARRVLNSDSAPGEALPCSGACRLLGPRGWTARGPLPRLVSSLGPEVLSPAFSICDWEGLETKQEKKWPRGNLKGNHGSLEKDGWVQRGRPGRHVGADLCAPNWGWTHAWSCFCL